ncbi:cysteine dioxygenase [Chromobacterium vaccinii]|uniref:cysteine dioxygenase n=1 Tax=Chromobacterium vaccinii TaxID=1108595 RepID=UPI000617E340|nr:cysteine dioxygenase family protein [Chromobacterium vaccinii]
MEASPDCPPFDACSPNLAASLRQLSLYSGSLNQEQILQFHRALRPTPQDLAPFRRFDDARYCRNRIYRDEHCELLLLCWRDGQRSQIHNHKGSLCGVRVIEGVATETVFETTLSGQLAARETRELATGSLVINGHLDIHQVANLQADGGDLVTLHLYSPPLSRMELFGMEPQQRRVQVLDDCLEFQI